MAINLSIGAKVAIGLVGASAVAGGGYLTNEYLIGTKITEFLKNDDLTLLTKEDDKAQGGKRGKEYVKQTSNKGQLKDYDEKKTVFTDAPESFKDACAYRSSKRINSTEDSIYSDISKYCTKGFTIASLIQQDKSIELITKKQAPSAGDSKGKNIGAKYFEDAKTDNPLGIDFAKPKAATKGEVSEQYEKKCQEKESTEVRNNKDNAYAVVKKGCTEPKSA